MSEGLKTLNTRIVFLEDFHSSPSAVINDNHFLTKLENTNIKRRLKFSFQIKKNTFSMIMSHPVFGTHLHFFKKMDFPSGTSGKEPACRCRRCKRPGV